MRKRSTWMAWTMVAILVVGCGIAVTLEVGAGDFGQDAVALYLAFTGFMVVGAVIVAHRPANAIGWIFSAIGLLAATGTLAMEYAAYAYVTRPGSLPAAIWPAWYQQQWWIPILALVFVATPMLFPTGRLPSACWRPVAAVAAVAPGRGGGGGGGGGAGAAGRAPADHQAAGRELPGRQPIGLAWFPDPETSPVGGALAGLLTACIVAAVISLVLRFRRSLGVERQQLKWFVYAGVLLILTIPVGAYLPAAIGALFGLIIAFVPVAAGIAILRYRLFDIDRVINRTLVYGLLTAILGLAYATIVLVLGQVFGGVSRDPPTSSGAGRLVSRRLVSAPLSPPVQAGPGLSI